MPIFRLLLQEYVIETVQMICCVQIMMIIILSVITTISLGLSSITEAY